MTGGPLSAAPPHGCLPADSGERSWRVPSARRPPSRCEVAERGGLSVKAAEEKVACRRRADQPRGPQDWPEALEMASSRESRSMPQKPRLPTVCRGAAESASAQCLGRDPPKSQDPLAPAALTPGRSPAPLRPLFLPHRMDTVILGDSLTIQPRHRPGPPGRTDTQPGLCPQPPPSSPPRGLSHRGGDLSGSHMSAWASEAAPVTDS